MTVMALTRAATAAVMPVKLLAMFMVYRLLCRVPISGVDDVGVRSQRDFRGHAVRIRFAANRPFTLCVSMSDESVMLLAYGARLLALSARTLSTRTGSGRLS